MSRAARGYLLVAGSFLIMGLIGALVDWATAPESALLVLRFATAGLVLGVVFARRRPLAGAAERSVWPRLLLMAAVDAFTLLLFFVAIRGTSVAIGMFLQFLAPVWVALIAPRVFRARTEAIVYPALAIALAGLAVILAPSLLGEGVTLSPWGVAAGLLAGVGYAVFQLVVKDLTRRISAVTIVFTEAWLDALILLPLALWQTVGAGYQLTTRDLVAGVGPRGRLHGAGVPDVDLRHGHGQGAAQLDPRLPGAGVGAHLRAAPARPGHLGLDHHRRRPHRGRRPAGGAAGRARGRRRQVLEPAP